jgi:hypothetical protein
MVKLSISSNVTSLAGQTVKVPIVIDDATGLQSIDLTLKYNTTILDVIDPNPATTENENIVKGDLTTNWSLGNTLINPTANVNEAAGLITISFGNTTPLTSGSGTVLAINFQVANNAPVNSTSILDLDTAILGINGQDVSSGITLEDGKLTVTASNSFLDADGDGKVNALTDGLLIFGYLNLRNIPVPGIFNQLNNLIQTGSARTSGQDVANFLGNVSLDVDGDGKVNALTDGLLMFGYLNLRNIPVPGIFNQLNNLIQTGSTRTTGQDIANYLQNFLPVQSGSIVTSSLSESPSLATIEIVNQSDSYDLLGSAKNDILLSTSIDELIYGGAGEDIFAFESNSGKDIIEDFVVAEDKIRIAASLGFSNSNEILAGTKLTILGNGTLASELSFGNGNIVTILHDEALTTDNFFVV